MTEQFFLYKNTPIAFQSKGKGSAVILIHGFLENKTMWKELSPYLSKNNRILSVDILGHGKSGNIGYLHTMEEQASMIKALLNHLKLRRVTLIGHSLGGYISLAFAEMFNENTKGIVLMNSTAQADSFEKRKNREHAINIVKKNPDIFIKMAIPNLFSEESRILFKKEIEIIKSEALKTSKQGIIASLEGMKIRKDRTEILKKFNSKKLLVIGKKDPILNYTDLINQAKKTDTKKTVFDKGHMSHIENFKELKNELLLFIK